MVRQLTLLPPGLVLAISLAAAQVSPLALSPRNASYEIDVRLDTETNSLAATQTLIWRNITDRPTAELRFHLYWNAWRNDRSTWLTEYRLGGRSSVDLEDVRPEDWGWLVVDEITLVGGGGRRRPLPGARYDAPDDGNTHDRTVLVVPLPEQVGPDEAVRVEMTWRAKVPRTFARTGHRDDYYLVAHWFPKVGVLEPDGWSCPQFHAATEFHADYGVYDVRISVPDDWVVGATGRKMSRQDNGDGTATHRHYQEDVHGFAWTASPSFVVREARFADPGMPPVDMRLLLQPEHVAQADRHFEATRAALRFYGSWYGPYPYGHVTIVDPAWSSRTGGMEYPTLFTCGTRLFHPPGGDGPESVVIHETGHQFWYGVVGNDEFRYGWLDEGLTTYSTARVLDTAYPPRVLVERYLTPPASAKLSRRGFLAARFPEFEVDRWEGAVRAYRSAGWMNDPHAPTWQYYPDTASATTYDKTALWLVTLERHLGWPTLRRILSELYDRHAFGHPTPEDFFDVAREVADQDLTWFFDQVWRDSVRFDYAVADVRSRPAGTRGFGEDGDDLVFLDSVHADGAEDRPTFRNEIAVRRIQDGVFPVDVQIVFEDGHETRERWDGEERWKYWVIEHPARVERVVVDPDRVLMLDVDRTNNGLRRESASAAPARKWASKWMLWLQDRLWTFAFFL